MHLVKGFTLMTGILSMAIGLTATQASAQQATFHLPFTAHWGISVLQPGEYTLTSPSLTMGRGFFSIRGNGKTVFVPEQLTEFDSQPGKSYLQVVNVNGAYYVREFHSGTNGRHFTFLLPKNVEKQVHGGRPEVTTIRAVTK